MGGVGHWPLDVIKRFVLIVMDAIGCVVEDASSQTGLSKSRFENILLSSPIWLTEIFPQVQRLGSTFHESSAIYQES